RAEGRPPRAGALYARGVGKVSTRAAHGAARLGEVQPDTGPLHGPRSLEPAIERRRRFGGVHADAGQARSRSTDLDHRQPGAGGSADRPVGRGRRRPPARWTLTPAVVYSRQSEVFRRETDADD